MKIAIIGCGYSGLSAIRRCVEQNIECIAFELSGEVGGLWVYTDKIGNDEYGIPIQTSLYYNVRTNSPVQTLELPDFKFKTEDDTDYPRHTEVRRYLNDFAKRFNLHAYIKFHHYVSLVSRENGKYKIVAKNLKAQKDELYYVDGVMVCNGHTAKPHTPKYIGSEQFTGLAIHCHDYRRNVIFENKNVLVVGAGPSGIEVAYESILVAKKTFMSQRGDDISTLPSVISKPEIRLFQKNEIVFADESVELIDVIVFCTGYEYYFPFLDESCCITVEEEGQIVKPLYKHFINIEEPTMCFIGLFQRTIISYLFDFQVQAFLKIITGQISLPSKAHMFKWLDGENERKKKRGIPPNQYYHLSADIVPYFKELTAFAELANIPPVLFKIFRKNEQTYIENFYDLRRWRFKIIDKNNYTCTLKAISY